MNKGETRLQSLTVQAAMNDLDDLQGQVLADVAFQRKVAALKRKALREILGSFGKALEAFSGQWQALDVRHREERERFARREASFAGRCLNTARGMPFTGFGAAVAHLRAGMTSAGARERVLAHAHIAERNDIALRQRRYRQALSKPHEDALEMLRVKTEINKAPVLAARPGLLNEVALKAARLRIAGELSRSIDTARLPSVPRDRDRVCLPRSKTSLRDMD
jgi:hypothetical protein